MIRDVLNQILLNISKQYPIIGRGINMYSFIETNHVLNSSTFERRYVDYVNGKFWSRNWEQEGADPSRMRREYPFVTLENVSMVRPEYGQGCGTYEFWVMVGDQIQCPDCPERSEVDIYSDLYLRANHIMNEVYSTFEWTDGTKTIYATKKYVTYWQGKGQLTGMKQGKRVVNESQEEIRITANNIGHADGIVAVSFKFTATEKIPEINFNYDPVVPDQIGEVKCDVC